MWVCRCWIRCGIVGFDCPSCDLRRPVPGCLSAHSLAPTRAVVWLSGHETVGQTLLFLHMHLFLHLHLLPCRQPLVDLSGLGLDVLAAGMLASWPGSPGRKLGLSGSFNLCCTFQGPWARISTKEPSQSVSASLPLMSSSTSLPQTRPPKTPNPSQIWVRLPNPPQARFALACQGSQMFFRRYQFGTASSLKDNCAQ